MLTSKEGEPEIIQNLIRLETYGHLQYEGKDCCLSPHNKLLW